MPGQHNLHNAQHPPAAKINVGTKSIRSEIQYSCKRLKSKPSCWPGSSPSLNGMKSHAALGRIIFTEAMLTCQFQPALSPHRSTPSDPIQSIQSNPYNPISSYIQILTAKHPCIPRQCYTEMHVMHGTWLTAFAI